ncbi:hypothetical protein ACFU5O_36570 [Streptomyces sp. NPDC057445]|uniref:hypothetical protein n=1 Tax=Streptomyces sp. NPDC057445 TaxID=3346136 RepID=UPI00367E6CD5
MSTAEKATENGPARQTAVRTKPVRLTVDMTPVLRRRLRAWTGMAADELGLVDVPAAEVIRALVGRLTDLHGDPELRRALSKAVMDDLQAVQQ